MVLPAILLLAILGAPSQLVLRDGSTIPIRELVVVENNRVLYRGVHGTLYSIPLQEVDLESTTDPDRPREPRRSRAVSAANPEAGLRRLSVSKEEKERLLSHLEKTARTVERANETVNTESISSRADTEEPKEENSEDEAAWRAIATQLRARIDQSRSALEQARHREQELNDFILFVAGSSGDAEGYSNYVEELADVRDRIPRLEASLERAESAWRDFVDLARQKGILPGWLR